MVRKRRKFRGSIIVVAVLILALVGYILINNAVQPTVLSLTEARLRAIGVKAMNDAVQETIGSGIVYTDLIDIHKDSMGKIVLISINSALMSSLAAQTATCAQEKILNIGEQGISIPIGTVIGGQFLSGRGPAIKVKIEPVGSVTSQFNTKFEDAGINQTRHRIYLSLTATVRIVVGNVSQSVEITSQVLVSDTIIIGDVPQSYFQGSQDELLNLLPSGGD